MHGARRNTIELDDVATAQDEQSQHKQQTGHGGSFASQGSTPSLRRDPEPTASCHGMLQSAGQQRACAHLIGTLLILAGRVAPVR